MFTLMVSRSSLKLGLFESETRSSGQIKGKPLILYLLNKYWVYNQSTKNKQGGEFFSAVYTRDVRNELLISIWRL